VRWLRSTDSVVMVAPTSTTATSASRPTASWSVSRANAFSIANASTSTTLAVRPPSSSAATRMSTFSVREAASRMLFISGLSRTGPSTSKSRLTSSIG